ncbi:hypothetical protein DFR68_105262 [Nocardia mexicana]|uniref:Uncharacterized protein n=2 Tax=Nocardia mexicana TaxID=279262 RepID=A0A370H3J2_9NOCA|nr:hypothetical protein DFR68_105262 [Nocardia mexicana]
MRAAGRGAMVAAVVATVITGSSGVSAAQDGDTDDGPNIQCRKDIDPQAHHFYPGESGGTAYDAVFTRGTGKPLPDLGSYVPQGAATWGNWDGQGNDLLLVTQHGPGNGPAHIAGIDLRTYETVGVVTIEATHAGGIGVTGNGWVYVSGGQNRVLRFSQQRLREELPRRGNLEHTGSLEVAGSSFLSGFGDKLYAGTFDKDKPGTMARYGVGADGALLHEEDYQVPRSTQGLLVTEKNFVFSSSYGRTKRGNIYVAAHGERTIAPNTVQCFRTPSMPEGIAGLGNTAYLVFESGAGEFANDPKTRNKISDVHMADIGALVAPRP